MHPEVIGYSQPSAAVNTETPGATTAASRPLRLRKPAADGGFDTVIVISCVMSGGIAAVYWLMRIGFDNPLMPVVKPVALAVFIFTFPEVVRWIPSRARRAEEEFSAWWLSYPFLWLVALGVTAILGRLAAAFGLNAFPVIGFVGAVAFAIILVRWLPASSAGRTLTIIAGAVAFSIWAAGVVWGRIYKNPLFLENFILDGKVHHDSLGLAAIANMIRTYHVATTGIDGLNYVPYHWGSGWLFAQWSNLTGAQVLDFYQLGFPVTMVPFFFGGVLAFAVAMRNRRGGREAGADLRTDFLFWFVFLVACIGIIPISGLDGMAVWTSNVLISESYTVAVPCALLFLATVITFHDSAQKRARAEASRVESIVDALFILVGIPIGIALLGYLKISLMVLAFALAVYAFVRLRLYRRRIYVASAALSAILFYLAYTQVSLPAHREGFALFDFLWSYVQPAWWPFFVVVHLFWSWLYVLLRFRSEGIGTVTDLREAVVERRLLDVEALALIALLGLVPGLITHIDGGSAFYFSDVQRWLAVGLMLSRIPVFAPVFAAERSVRAPKTSSVISRIDAVTVRGVLLAFLLLPVIGSVISNSLVWPVRMARANAETRHALYPASVAAMIPPGIHGLPHLHDFAMLDQGLRRRPNFVVAGALRSMSAFPDSVRRRTALFIPQSQGTFWNSLTRPGACTFQPLVAPAFADMAMIDGMPPYGCEVNRYYGMGSFKKRSRPQTLADLEPSTLCRRAAADGMDRVLILVFDGSTRASTTAVQCREVR